jgi:cell division protein FtsB
VRTLLRTLLVLLLVPIALAALGFGLYAPRWSATSSRAEAARQLAHLLDDGERVASVTPASRRLLWRYYHPIAGVLAATDRRLLWVGVTPRALIEWSAAEPPVFEVASWTYDSAVVAATRVHLGLSSGLAVRAAPGAEPMRFAVRPADAGTRQAVLATLERRQTELRAETERERAEQERLAFLARQPIYHTVQAGEAVISIAAQYGLTPDSLRALNGLTSDRIRVGQVLLVKPGS